MKDEIALLEEAFNEVCSLAWENAPDADPEFYDRFCERMNTAEAEFAKALKALKGGAK